MKTARRILDILVGAACSLILALMVAILAWQVFSRYALNTPSTYSEEVLRYGMIWASFLGAAFAAGRGSHMSIDLAASLAKGRTARVLTLLVPISFMLFAILVLILGGWQAMGIAAGQRSAVLQVPMAWVYAAMPTGGVFILIYSILNFLERLTGAPVDAAPDEQAMATGD